METLREQIIEVLCATRYSSEGVAADAIIAVISQQEAEPVEECNDCLELIDERDSWEERATALADAVGEYFGVPVGEHTSANCPINEAMKILNGEYQTPAVDKAWNKFQTAINAPQPVASAQDVEEFIAATRGYHHDPREKRADKDGFVLHIHPADLRAWMAGHALYTTTETQGET